MGTMWHCTLAGCTTSQAIKLVLRCTLLRAIIGSLCYLLDRLLFHHDGCDYYWDFYGHAGSSGSATTNHFGWLLWKQLVFFGNNHRHRRSLLWAVDILFLSLSIYIYQIMMFHPGVHIWYKPITQYSLDISLSINKISKLTTTSWLKSLLAICF